MAPRCCCTMLPMLCMAVLGTASGANSRLHIEKAARGLLQSALSEWGDRMGKCLSVGQLLPDDDDGPDGDPGAADVAPSVSLLLALLPCMANVISAFVTVSLATGLLISGITSLPAVFWQLDPFFIHTQVRPAVVITSWLGKLFSLRPRTKAVFWAALCILPALSVCMLTILLVPSMYQDELWPPAAAKFASEFLALDLAAAQIWASIAVLLLDAMLLSLLCSSISGYLSHAVANFEGGEERLYISGHVLVIGWGSKLLPLLEELCLGKAYAGGGTIVLLTELPKLEMEMQLARRRLPLHGSLILCRSGNPLLRSDLARVSVETASSVIVLDTEHASDEGDARLLAITLRLLPIVSEVEQWTSRSRLKRGGVRGQIITETSSSSYANLMKQLVPATGGSEDKLRVIMSRELVARLMVQVARAPHLASVIMELVSSQRSTFHLPEGGPRTKPVHGCSFGSLQAFYPKAVPIGVKYANNQGMQLNPPADYVVKKDDAIILLASGSDCDLWPLSSRQQQGHKHVSISPITGKAPLPFPSGIGAKSRRYSAVSTPQTVPYTPATSTAPSQAATPTTSAKGSLSLIPPVVLSISSTTQVTKATPHAASSSHSQPLPVHSTPRPHHFTSYASHDPQPQGASIPVADGPSREPSSQPFPCTLFAPASTPTTTALPGPVPLAANTGGSGPEEKMRLTKVWSPRRSSREYSPARVCSGSASGSPEVSALSRLLSESPGVSASARGQPGSAADLPGASEPVSLQTKLPAASSTRPALLHSRTSSGTSGTASSGKGSASVMKPALMRSGTSSGGGGDYSSISKGSVSLTNPALLCSGTSSGAGTWISSTDMSSSARGGSSSIGSASSMQPTLLRSGASSRGAGISIDAGSASFSKGSASSMKPALLRSGTSSGAGAASFSKGGASFLVSRRRVGGDYLIVDPLAKPADSEVNNSEASHASRVAEPKIQDIHSTAARAVARASSPDADADAGAGAGAGVGADAGGSALVPAAPCSKEKSPSPEPSCNSPGGSIPRGPSTGTSTTAPRRGMAWVSSSSLIATAAMEITAGTSDVGGLRMLALADDASLSTAEGGGDEDDRLTKPHGDDQLSKPDGDDLVSNPFLGSGRVQTAHDAKNPHAIHTNAVSALPAGSIVAGSIPVPSFKKKVSLNLRPMVLSHPSAGFSAERGPLGGSSSFLATRAASSPLLVPARQVALKRPTGRAMSHSHTRLVQSHSRVRFLEPPKASSLRLKQQWPMPDEADDGGGAFGGDHGDGDYPLVQPYSRESSETNPYTEAEVSAAMCPHRPLKKRVSLMRKPVVVLNPAVGAAFDLGGATSAAPTPLDGSEYQTYLSPVLDRAHSHVKFMPVDSFRLQMRKQALHSTTSENCRAAIDHMDPGAASADASGIVRPGGSSVDDDGGDYPVVQPYSRQPSPENPYTAQEVLAAISPPGSLRKRVSLKLQPDVVLAVPTTEDGAASDTASSAATDIADDATAEGEVAHSEGGSVDAHSDPAWPLPYSRISFVPVDSFRIQRRRQLSRLGTNHPAVMEVIEPDSAPDSLLSSVSSGVTSPPQGGPRSHAIFDSSGDEDDSGVDADEADANDDDYPVVQPYLREASHDFPYTTEEVLSAISSHSSPQRDVSFATSCLRKEATSARSLRKETPETKSEELSAAMPLPLGSLKHDASGGVAATTSLLRGPLRKRVSLNLRTEVMAVPGIGAALATHSLPHGRLRKRVSLNLQPEVVAVTEVGAAFSTRSLPHGPLRKRVSLNLRPEVVEAPDIGARLSTHTEEAAASYRMRKTVSLSLRPVVIPEPATCNVFDSPHSSCSETGVLEFIGANPVLASAVFAASPARAVKAIRDDATTSTPTATTPSEPMEASPVLASTVFAAPPTRWASTAESGNKVPEDINPVLASTSFAASPIQAVKHPSSHPPDHSPTRPVAGVGCKEPDEQPVLARTTFAAPVFRGVSTAASSANELPDNNLVLASAAFAASLPPALNTVAAEGISEAEPSKPAAMTRLLSHVKFMPVDSFRILNRRRAQPRVASAAGMDDQTDGPLARPGEGSGRASDDFFYTPEVTAAVALSPRAPTDSPLKRRVSLWLHPVLIPRPLDAVADSAMGVEVGLAEPSDSDADANEQGAALPSSKLLAHMKITPVDSFQLQLRRQLSQSRKTGTDQPAVMQFIDPDSERGSVIESDSSIGSFLDRLVEGNLCEIDSCPDSPSHGDLDSRDGGGGFVGLGMSNPGRGHLKFTPVDSFNLVRQKKAAAASCGGDGVAGGVPVSFRGAEPPSGSCDNSALPSYSPHAHIKLSPMDSFHVSKKRLSKRRSEPSGSAHPAGLGITERDEEPEGSVIHFGLNNPTHDHIKLTPTDSFRLTKVRLSMHRSAPTHNAHLAGLDMAGLGITERNEEPEGSVIHSGFSNPTHDHIKFAPTDSFRLSRDRLSKRHSEGHLVGKEEPEGSVRPSGLSNPTHDHIKFAPTDSFRLSRDRLSKRHTEPNGHLHAVQPHERASDGSMVPHVPASECPIPTGGRKVSFGIPSDLDDSASDGSSMVNGSDHLGRHHGSSAGDGGREVPLVVKGPVVINFADQGSSVQATATGQQEMPIQAAAAAEAAETAAAGVATPTAAGLEHSEHRKPAATVLAPCVTANANATEGVSAEANISDKDSTVQLVLEAVSQIQSLPDAVDKEKDGSEAVSDSESSSTSVRIIPRRPPGASPVDLKKNFQHFSNCRSSSLHRLSRAVSGRLDPAVTGSYVTSLVANGVAADIVVSDTVAANTVVFDTVVVDTVVTGSVVSHTVVAPLLVGSVVPDTVVSDTRGVDTVAAHSVFVDAMDDSTVVVDTEVFDSVVADTLAIDHVVADHVVVYAMDVDTVVARALALDHSLARYGGDHRGVTVTPTCQQETLTQAAAAITTATTPTAAAATPTPTSAAAAVEAPTPTATTAAAAIPIPTPGSLPAWGEVKAEVAAPVAEAKPPVTTPVAEAAKPPITDVAEAKPPVTTFVSEAKQLVTAGSRAAVGRGIATVRGVEHMPWWDQANAPAEVLAQTQAAISAVPSSSAHDVVFRFAVASPVGQTGPGRQTRVIPGKAPVPWWDRVGSEADSSCDLSTAVAVLPTATTVLSTATAASPTAVQPTSSAFRPWWERVLEQRQQAELHAPHASPAPNDDESAIQSINQIYWDQAEETLGNKAPQVQSTGRHYVHSEDIPLSRYSVPVISASAKAHGSVWVEVLARPVSWLLAITRLLLSFLVASTDTAAVAHSAGAVGAGVGAAAGMGASTAAVLTATGPRLYADEIPWWERHTPVSFEAAADGESITDMQKQLRSEMWSRIRQSREEAHGAALLGEHSHPEEAHGAALHGDWLQQPVLRLECGAARVEGSHESLQPCEAVVQGQHVSRQESGAEMLKRLRQHPATEAEAVAKAEVEAEERAWKAQLPSLSQQAAAQQPKTKQEATQHSEPTPELLQPSELQLGPLQHPGTKLKPPQQADIQEEAISGHLDKAPATRAEPPTHEAQGQGSSTTALGQGSFKRVRDGEPSPPYEQSGGGAREEVWAQGGGASPTQPVNSSRSVRWNMDFVPFDGPHLDDSRQGLALTCAAEPMAAEEGNGGQSGQKGDSALLEVVKGVIVGPKRFSDGSSPEASLMAQQRLSTAAPKGSDRWSTFGGRQLGDFNNDVLDHTFVPMSAVGSHIHSLALSKEKAFGGRFLMCGWGPGMFSLIRILDYYLDFDSELWLYSGVPRKSRRWLLAQGGIAVDEDGRAGCLRHLRLVFKDSILLGSLLCKAQLTKLFPLQFKSIFVIAAETCRKAFSAADGSRPGSGGLSSLFTQSSIENITSEALFGSSRNSIDSKSLSTVFLLRSIQIDQLRDIQQLSHMALSKPLQPHAPSFVAGSAPTSPRGALPPTLSAEEQLIEAVEQLGVTNAAAKAIRAIVLSSEPLFDPSSQHPFEQPDREGSGSGSGSGPGSGSASGSGSGSALVHASKIAMTSQEGYGSGSAMVVCGSGSGSGSTDLAPPLLRISPSRIPAPTVTSPRIASSAASKIPVVFICSTNHASVPPVSSLHAVPGRLGPLSVAVAAPSLSPPDVLRQSPGPRAALELASMHAVVADADDNDDDDVNISPPAAVFGTMPQLEGSVPRTPTCPMLAPQAAMPQPEAAQGAPRTTSSFRPTPEGAVPQSASNQGVIHTTSTTYSWAPQAAMLQADGGVFHTTTTYSWAPLAAHHLSGPSLADVPPLPQGIAVASDDSKMWRSSGVGQGVAASNSSDDGGAHEDGGEDEGADVGDVLPLKSVQVQQEEANRLTSLPHWMADLRSVSVESTIITELMEPEMMLLTGGMVDVSRFITGSDFIGRMMAMVCTRPERLEVFMQLFSAEGPNLRLLPCSECMQVPGELLTFYELSAHIMKRGEVLIGYIERPSGKAVLNPGNKGSKLLGKATVEAFVTIAALEQ